MKFFVCLQGEKKSSFNVKGFFLNFFFIKHQET